MGAYSLCSSVDKFNGFRMADVYLEENENWLKWYKPIKIR
jgi:hypothetical protein